MTDAKNDAELALQLDRAHCDAWGLDAHRVTQRDSDRFPDVKKNLLSFLAAARALLAPKPDAATVPVVGERIIVWMKANEWTVDEVCSPEQSEGVLKWIGLEGHDFGCKKHGRFRMKNEGATWCRMQRSTSAEVVRLQGENEALKGRLQDYMDLAQTHDECDSARKLEDEERTAELKRLQGELAAERSLVRGLRGNLETWLGLSRGCRAPRIGEHPAGPVREKIGNLEAQREADHQVGKPGADERAEIRAQAFEEMRVEMRRRAEGASWEGATTKSNVFDHVADWATKQRDACKAQTGATPEQAPTSQVAQEPRDPSASRVVADGKVHWCAQAPADVTTENLDAADLRDVAATWENRHKMDLDRDRPWALVNLACDVATACRRAAVMDIRANLTRAADRFQIKLSEVEAGYQAKIAERDEGIQIRADLLRRIAEAVVEVRPETATMGRNFPDLACETLREQKAKIAELEAKLARRTELLRTLRHSIQSANLVDWYVRVDRELDTDKPSTRWNHVCPVRWAMWECQNCQRSYDGVATHPPQHPCGRCGGTDWREVRHGEENPAKLPEPGETVWVKARVGDVSQGAFFPKYNSGEMSQADHGETWLRDDEARGHADEPILDRVTYQQRGTDQWELHVVASPGDSFTVFFPGSQRAIGDAMFGALRKVAKEGKRWISDDEARKP